MYVCYDNIGGPVACTLLGQHPSVFTSRGRDLGAANKFILWFWLNANHEPCCATYKGRLFPADLSLPILACQSALWSPLTLPDPTEFSLVPTFDICIPAVLFQAPSYQGTSPATSLADPSLGCWGSIFADLLWFSLQSNVLLCYPQSLISVLHFSVTCLGQISVFSIMSAQVTYSCIVQGQNSPVVISCPYN